MKIRTILITIILFTTVFNIIPAENTNKTIYVDDDGGADYTKIQDAIDNASDGDTIFVYNGYYQEYLYINKSVSLKGENTQTTTIDGGGEYGVVYVSTSTFSISGFTIQNSGKCYENYGGVMADTNHITIENNYFIDNWFSGIFLFNSKNRMDRRCYNFTKLFYR